MYEKEETDLFEVEEFPLLNPLLGLQLLGLLQDPGVHVRHVGRHAGPEGGEGRWRMVHHRQTRGGVQNVVKERCPLIVGRSRGL